MSEPVEKHIESGQPEPDAKPRSHPDLEALFSAAVAGQERIQREFGRVSGEEEVPIEVEGDDPAPEADAGIRGMDPRELQARIIAKAKVQAQELEEAQADRARQKEEIVQLTDRLMRLQADYENFRKRQMREREDQLRHANEKFLRELLPVIDHFELALDNADSSDPSALLQGVRMILVQMGEVLGKFGVTAIDSRGMPFDPALHEAFQQVESSEVPEGHVAIQYQKGYQLHGRLLRPARVAVAKPPSGVGAA